MSSADSPRDWDGLLAVDKPEGPTSHDVVAQIRRLTRVRRVGHSGTLDPPASGLLLVAIGRATRLIRFLPQQPKVYTGVLRLGSTTSTDDAAGELIERHDGPLPSELQVLEAAAALEGDQMQVPPAVSARKVGGERLYRLARRGETVVAPPRPATVFRFRLDPRGAAEYSYEASVSAGTYIRSLARDLGESLGCGGHVRSLRRVEIGSIDLTDAVDPMQDSPAADLRAAWTSLDRIPLALPTLVAAGSNEDRLFGSGVALGLDRFQTAEAETPGQAPDFRKVLSSTGGLLGVGEQRSGQVRPTVVIPA